MVWWCWIIRCRCWFSASGWWFFDPGQIQNPVVVSAPSHSMSLHETACAVQYYTRWFLWHYWYLNLDLHLIITKFGTRVTNYIEMANKQCPWGKWNDQCMLNNCPWWGTECAFWPTYLSISMNKDIFDKWYLSNEWSGKHRSPRTLPDIGYNIHALRQACWFSQWLYVYTHDSTFQVIHLNFIWRVYLDDHPTNQPAWFNEMFCTCSMCRYTICSSEEPDALQCMFTTQDDGSCDTQCCFLRHLLIV